MERSSTPSANRRLPGDTFAQTREGSIMAGDSFREDPGSFVFRRVRRGHVTDSRATIGTLREVDPMQPHSRFAPRRSTWPRRSATTRLERNPQGEVEHRPCFRELGAPCRTSSGSTELHLLDRNGSLPQVQLDDQPMPTRFPRRSTPNARDRSVYGVSMGGASHEPAPWTDR